MNRLLFLFPLTAAFAQAEPPAKSIDLLAARDLAGWEFVSNSATAITSVCTVAPDGTLAVIGKPVGYLATKASHTNYRLHAEWRWPATAAKNSNGGVLLHIASGPTNATPWPVCVQLQLKLARAGDLLPMHEAKFAEKLSTAPGARTPQLDRLAADSEKPLGQWNSCDVVCRGDTIQVTINGVLQNKITRCVPEAGRIGFQLEGAPFELRNVRLTPLD